MRNELIINGNDAWETYHVRMGTGLLDTLEADADNKDYVTNSIRTEDGDRILPIRPKIASRTITLEFVIVGSDHDDYNARVKAFDAIMDNGFLTIQVPRSKEDIYRLFCARKSSSYARGAGTIGKKSIKFIEPNPRNRGELTDEEKKMYNLSEIEEFLK